jgi:hypothetical protein
VVNFYKALPGEYVNVAKEIIRAPGRAATSIFASLTKQKEIKPETKTEKLIWGSDPVPNVRERGAQTVKQFGGSEGTAKKLGLPLGIALTGFDIFPGGNPEKKGLLEAGKIVKHASYKNALRIIRDVDAARVLVKDLKTGAELTVPKKGLSQWAGTESSKQSKAGDTSISSAPIEREDVSVPKTDTSVPFEETTYKAVRKTKDGFEKTDDIRGGTWYATEDSADIYGNRADLAIGGDKTVRSDIALKNPATVEVSTFDAGFSVISSVNEKLLPPKYVAILKHFDDTMFTLPIKDVSDGSYVNEAAVGAFIKKTLKEAGISDEQIRKIYESPDDINSAVDAIVAKGLQENGYDGLVLKGRGATHVFEFPKKTSRSPELSSLDKKALAQHIEQQYKVPGAYAEQIAGMAHEVKITGGDEAAIRETIENNVKQVPGAKLPPKEGGTPTGDRPFELQPTGGTIKPEAKADWEANYADKSLALTREALAMGKRLEGMKEGASYSRLSRQYDASLQRSVKPVEEWAQKWGIDPKTPEAKALLKTGDLPKRVPEPSPATAATRNAKLRGGQGSTPGELPPLPRHIGEYLTKRERPTTPKAQREAIQEAEGRLKPTNPEYGEVEHALRKSIQHKVKTVRSKVHILDYLGTPEYVLEKMGLGRGAEALRTGMEGYQKELPKEIERITNWSERVKALPNSSERIFRFLDGKSVILKEEEHKVADEIKRYLKQWADRLDLPQDKRIAHYITHIFDPDFIQKEFDPDLAKIIADKLPGEVYDPFLQKRLGASGYKEDAWAALDAYVKRAVRKSHMDPALDIIQKAAATLDIDSFNYVKRFAHRVNMRPTETENLLDNLVKNVVGYKFGQRPVANLSRKARQIVYRGTLGLNIGSAIRNLTQGVNTYAKLGEKYTIVGYSKLVSRLLTNNLDELYEHSVLSDNLIQERTLGVYKKGLQKMDTGLFALFDLAEKINRGAAYFGAKSKAIQRGMTEKDAIAYAKRIVRETQFQFSSIDTPVALNDDVVKTFTQMQSFNIKQVEFLGGMVKEKDIAGLIRWVGGSMALVYSLGQLIGMKPTDVIPTVRLGGSPIPSTIGAAVQSVTARTDQQAEDAKKKLKGSIFTVIPAGVQTRKTIQGALALDKGETTTATGKHRYDVPSDFWTALRALAFGPNNLPQAKEYFDGIGKKKEGTSGNPFDN